MKKGVVLFICLTFGFFTQTLQAQENTLMMDIRNDGILLPKVTTAQRKAAKLTASEVGLIVFDLNNLSFWYWNGSDWMAIKTDNLIATESGTVVTTAKTAYIPPPPPPPSSRFDGLDIQERLNAGQKPMDIVAAGFPVADLYGKTYQGGLIFYVDIYDQIPGVDGMVVSPAVISGGLWGCKGTSVTTAEALDKGRANTDAILTACDEASIAASIARNFKGGAFNDWSLPSKEELQQILNNLSVFLGSFWSSSEIDDATAYYAQSGASVTFAAGKKAALFANVIAVRSF